MDLKTLSVLHDLLNSEDEDIVDAVHEAAMAGDDWAEGTDDDEDDEW